MYVLIEKKMKIITNYPCYFFLPGALQRVKVLPLDMFFTQKVHIFYKTMQTMIRWLSLCMSITILNNGIQQLFYIFLQIFSFSSLLSTEKLAELLYGGVTT